MMSMTSALAVLVATDHDQLKLPLAMLLVFGAAKLLDELFERINQPLSLIHI